MEGVLGRSRLRLSGHAAYRGDVVVLWPTRARTSRGSKSMFERISFIFWCSDSYRVSVDTVHPYLLRSSSFILPGGTISRVFLPTYSWSSLFTCPNHLSFAFMYISVIFSTSSLSLMLSFLTWSVIVWPQSHLYIFISVTSSFFIWDRVTGTD